MEAYSVLPFTLSGHRLAVPVQNVLKVLPALLSTPLPGAPDTVRGLVNVRGQLLPLIDLARRFGWESAQQSLWQPFVWLKSSRRELLLAVQSVEPVCSYQAADFSPAPDPRVPSAMLRGVVRTADGMLLIQDVEKVLSAADEECLANALAEHGGTFDENG